MQSRLRRGITLVQTLVVITIIVVVTAILGLTIGPRAKVKAKEVRVKSDLRQFASAINLYRSDFDDRLPVSRDNLYAWGKGNLPKWELDESFVQPTDMPWAGYVNYFFTMPWEFQQIASKVPLKHPFSESNSSIVKAKFWRRSAGNQIIPFEVTLWPDGQIIDAGRDPVKVLGARLDGSVGWFWLLEDFQMETMNYYHLNSPPPR